MLAQSRGQEDPLEEGRVLSHSSMCAWRAPWTEGTIVRMLVGQPDLLKLNQGLGWAEAKMISGDIRLLGSN